MAIILLNQQSHYSGVSVWRGDQQLFEELFAPA